MLPELEVVFGQDIQCEKGTLFGYTTSYYIDTCAGGKSGNDSSEITKIHNHGSYNVHYGRTSHP